MQWCVKLCKAKVPKQYRRYVHSIEFDSCRHFLVCWKDGGCVRIHFINLNDWQICFDEIRTLLLPFFVFVFAHLRPPTTTSAHLQPPPPTYNHLQQPTTTYNHLQPPTTTYNHLQPLARMDQCYFSFQYFIYIPGVNGKVVLHPTPQNLYNWKYHVYYACRQGRAGQGRANWAGEFHRPMWWQGSLKLSSCTFHRIIGHFNHGKDWSAKVTQSWHLTPRFRAWGPEYIFIREKHNQILVHWKNPRSQGLSLANAILITFHLHSDFRHYDNRNNSVWSSWHHKTLKCWLIAVEINQSLWR